MDKDWEARFNSGAGRRAGSPKSIQTAAAKVACGYWIAVMLLFLLLARGGDVTGEGGALLIVPTMPWSLLAMGIAASVSSPSNQEALRHFSATYIGVFIEIPLICGGLNALTIFGLGSFIQRWRHKKSQA